MSCISAAYLALFGMLVHSSQLLYPAAGMPSNPLSKRCQNFGSPRYHRGQKTVHESITTFEDKNLTAILCDSLDLYERVDHFIYVSMLDYCSDKHLLLLGKVALPFYRPLPFFF